MGAQDVTHAKYVEYATAVGVSPNTIRLDQVAAKSLTETGTTPEQAEPADIDTWWIHVGRKGLTPATRTYYLRALRRYYKWRTQRTGEPDPTTHITALPIPARVPRPVPRALAHKATSFPGDTGIMVGLALFAGLRVHEIARLTPSSIRTDDNGHRYLYVIGKGSRERRVPLADELETMLARYTWPDVTPEAVTFRIRYALKRVTGQPYTAHQLRHTFATMLLDADSDLLTLQRLLGHASVTTTQVYADVSVERMHDAIGRTFPAA